MEIKNKVALVTGAGSFGGLGYATAKILIDNGAKVILMDVDEQSGMETVKALGDGATFVKVDVTSEDDVKKAIDIAVEKYGRIDIACNVAGLSIPSLIVGKKGAYPLDTWKKVIDIDLVGTFNVMRLAAEVMAKNEPNEDGEKGVIVNTSSIAAYHGEVGQTAYSAAKGGINSLSLVSARDLARHGIRCFAIAPGIFETPAYQKLPKPEETLEALRAKTVFPKRLGRPDEFARIVQVIIENPMLNGDVIRLDGAIRF